jgi:hypothetical protein
VTFFSFGIKALYHISFIIQNKMTETNESKKREEETDEKIIQKWMKKHREKCKRK